MLGALYVYFGHLKYMYIIYFTYFVTEFVYYRDKEGKPQKSSFFCGPATKAFTPPPPLGLVAIYRKFFFLLLFFRLKIARNSQKQLTKKFLHNFWNKKGHIFRQKFQETCKYCAFSFRQLNTIHLYTNINICICRLKQNIFNFSTATNEK